MKPLKSMCLLLPWALIACSNAPECRFSGDFVSEANAGCFVTTDDKLLLVEGKNGKLSLPGGTKKTGEAPQCTAERETWEETGISVEAQLRMRTFENAFQLFACNVVGTQALDGSSRPWGLEINAVHWLSVKEFEGKDWRFPDQTEFLKSELVKTVHPQKH